MSKYKYKRKGSIWKVAVNLTHGALRLLRKTISYGKRGALKLKNIMHVKGKIRGMNNGEIPMPLSRNFLEFLSFKKIFVLWVGLIIFFGFLYFFLSMTSPGNGLVGLDTASISNSLTDSLYFSFIAATSTGFGDITPLGISKTVSILEIICSMVVFAVVISKLVSFKQEIILNEIYDISFEEKINRMRSALYLSRSDITRINEKVSEGRVPKTTIDHMWSVMNTLYETLVDIQKLICPTQNKKADFIKKIGNFQIELILNSINLTINRLNELLAHLDSIPYNWRSGKNTEGVRSVLSVVDTICGYYTLVSIPKSVAKRIDELKAAKNDLDKRA